MFLPKPFLRLPLCKRCAKYHALKVPDMPDRMVAAIAVYFDVRVINRDGRIRAASLKTVVTGIGAGSGKSPAVSLCQLYTRREG
jgi:hypothetical protein